MHFYVIVPCRYDPVLTTPPSFLNPKVQQKAGKESPVITLAPSYSSIDALAVAYRAAGGVIATPTGIVNCAGTPPLFFDKWTYRPTDQLPNLYKGMLDMEEVTAVQAPSQAKGWTRIGVIQRELADCEFVGGHAAEWYQRPENLAAFLAVCPSGYLVFFERYLGTDRSLRVVYLYVKDGRVRVGSNHVLGGSEFDAWRRFAVRRKLSV